MKTSGADTSGPVQFIEYLRMGRKLAELLETHTLPPGVSPFVAQTMEIASSGHAHRIAAAFTYGREDVIPGMFRQVISRLSTLSPERWGTFNFYLERHIHTDADRHYPMTRRLVRRLCGDDHQRWVEAMEVARQCLAARLVLWDAILESLPARDGMRSGTRGDLALEVGAGG